MNSRTDSKNPNRSTPSSRTVHPLLVAAFPALFLYATNISQFSLDVLMVPVLVLVASAAALWALLGLALRSARKAALIVSLFFLLLFSFGHASSALPQYTWVIWVFWIGPNKTVFAVWTLLLLLGTWFSVRTKRDLQVLTRIVNVSAIVLVAISLFHITSYEMWSRGSSNDARESGAADEDLVATRRPDRLPDIYWIVVDAYAREDVLKQLYGYDNSGFIAYLREDKGFYVADRSTSNYCFTSLALPTTLNMTYLDAFLPELDPEVNNNVFLMRRFFVENRLIRFLKKQGYRTIAFSSGYVITEVPGYDEYLTPGWFYDEFQNALLDMTPAGTLFARMSRDEKWRTRLHFMFDGLGALAGRRSPKFVFAHFQSPHRPFVFGPHGEPVSAPHLWPPTGVTWIGPNEIDDYRRYYTGELTYVNTRLRQTIDTILERSDPKPVIILQGDHGPCSLLADPQNPTDAAIRERFPILNAYYLPGGRYEGLRPDITPVNSFRVVLNHLFGTEQELLENRNFYCTLEKLFKLTDVTETVRSGSSRTPPTRPKREIPR